jgi:hypothetical protein
MNFSKAVLIAMMASVSTPNAFAALRKTRGLLRGVANRQLSLAHVNADPNDDAPFGICEGDCDTDDDCEVGLLCFQRNSTQPVPGCEGGEQDTTPSDYCILDVTPAPSVSSAPSQQPSTTFSPSQAPSESVQPSAAPSESFKPSTSANPSLAPTPKPLGLLFAYPKEGPPADAYPLGLCVGDCDTDDQCAEGLYCFLRVANTAVPGCIGGEEDHSRTDYCTYIIPTTQPSAVLTLKPTVAPIPSPSEIPTPSESSKPPSSAKQTDQPTLSLASTIKTLGTLFAHTEESPPADAYPLGLCVGDCDTDDQCAEGLYCFLRVANTAVPGCIGGEEDHSRTDYCTYITPTNQSSAVLTSQPTVAPTPSPSVISEFHGLLKWIGPLVTDNIQTLQDPTTPQYAALNWLANVDGYDPSIDFFITPEQVYIERYVLALLYFSTNGHAWKNQYNFILPTSICDWNDEKGNGVRGVLCNDLFYVEQLLIRKFWVTFNSLDRRWGRNLIVYFVLFDLQRKVIFEATFPPRSRC